MGNILIIRMLNLAIGLFCGAIFLTVPVCLGMYLISYIPGAIGQMRMFRKCGIDKPWMAFVPVAGAYNLGLLAEKYDDGNHDVKKHGKKLLWLNALAAISGALIGVLDWILLALVFGFSIAAVHDSDFRLNTKYEIYLISLIAVIFLLGALIKVYIAFRAEVLLRVYSIFAPEKAKRFLVISVFVPLAMPCILLSLSSKEPQNIRCDCAPGKI